MAKQATTSKQPELPIPADSASLPAEVDYDASDFENERGAGMENVTAADVVIPRMTIIQALSPQMNPGKPEYIPEAKIGLFCNTATGDLFETLEVIPCFFARIFLEWWPRATGKGLAANHGTDPAILSQCKPDEKRRMMLPNGNYVAETAQYYVLNVTAGGRRAFIPLSSTQLKHSRKWMTLITGVEAERKDGSKFQPPFWYMSWNAKTVDESNPQGTWKSWKFSPGRVITKIDPSKRLLAEAKKYYEDVKAGLVRGDIQTQDEEEAVGHAAPDESKAF